MVWRCGAPFAQDPGKKGSLERGRFQKLEFLWILESLEFLERAQNVKTKNLGNVNGVFQTGFLK